MSFEPSSLLTVLCSEFMYIFQAGLAFFELNRSAFKVASSGTMLGTAAASLVFYPEVLGAQGLYIFTVSIYFAATTIFACAFQPALKQYFENLGRWKYVLVLTDFRNGRWAILFTIIFGGLVILNAKFSTESFIPLVPMALALTLSATVCADPVVRGRSLPEDLESGMDLNVYEEPQVELDPEFRRIQEDAYWETQRDVPWNELLLNHFFQGRAQPQYQQVPQGPISTGSRSEDADRDANASITSDGSGDQSVF